MDKNNKNETSIVLKAGVDYRDPRQLNYFGKNPYMLGGVLCSCRTKDLKAIRNITPPDGERE